LLCHNLEISNDEIISYKLRHPKAKKQAIESFQNMGYRCFAAGDSHNDIQMFEVATKGFFINAPKNISLKYPNINSFHNYNDLEKEILLNSAFVK
jgi:phosphoserine/homoserine phosphotransferase